MPNINSELLSTCLVWKITRTLLPFVDMNNHLPKLFYFCFNKKKWKALAHVNPCFPLRRANLLLIEWVSTIFFEHFLESIVVILSVMCLPQCTVNCVIILMHVSLIFLLLVFLWTSEVPWHLCFAPQLRASEISLYHIFFWALQSCKYLCFMLFIINMLVSLHGLHSY